MLRELAQSIKQAHSDAKLGFAHLGFWGIVTFYFIDFAVVEYVFQIFGKPGQAHYDVLFSCAGATGSFAALCFNASKSSENVEHSRSYRFEGYMLFRSAIYFIKAIFVRYVFDFITQAKELFGFSLEKLPYKQFLIKVVLTAFAYYGIILLMGGFVYAYLGLTSLEKMLKENT